MGRKQRKVSENRLALMRDSEEENRISLQLANRGDEVESTSLVGSSIPGTTHSHQPRRASNLPPRNVNKLSTNMSVSNRTEGGYS